MGILFVSKAVLSTTMFKIKLLSQSLNPAVCDILKNKCRLCTAVRQFSAKPNKLPEIKNNNSGSMKGKIYINPEDADIAPSLKSVLGDNYDNICSRDLVPGKGRPPEPPMDCCMSGCANCVWIQYAEELKGYYSDGTDRALKEIDTIENESLKAFLKLELGLL